MALKAGRVGVNPEDVDFMTGHVKKPNITDEPALVGYFNGQPVYQKEFTVTTGGQESQWIDSGYVVDINVISAVALVDTQVNNIMISYPVACYSDTDNKLLFMHFRNNFTSNFHKLIVQYTERNNVSALSIEED